MPPTYPTHRVLLSLLCLVTLLLSGSTVQAEPSQVSRHLALGNPSGAVADLNQPANYLILRDQYAVSYHRDRGIPNWVAWHLQVSDLGDTPRYTGSFITDTSLPNGWYRVTHGDYTNSGYDRGHMTPSAVSLRPILCQVDAAKGYQHFEAIGYQMLSSLKVPPIP